jgi:hypothetical protein
VFRVGVLLTLRTAPYHPQALRPIGILG